MRKSGWAAAAGLGSLVLLLTACGGSSGTSGPGATATATSTADPAGQPASGALPAPGSVVLIVQHSALGFVLADADGQVLYTYDKDAKGGSPTCTGSCAAVWLPLTGNPVASRATTGLGTLGTVADANGARQVTYNGMPLYTFKGARALSASANGTGGVWHVIKLSRSNVVGG